MHHCTYTHTRMYTELYFENNIKDAIKPKNVFLLSAILKISFQLVRDCLALLVHNEIQLGI